MNNKNFKLQELKRWLKTSLKNKISINEKTVIAYLMLGFAGFGTIAEAGWTNPWRQIYYYNKEGGETADAFTFGWDEEKNKVGSGSVMITKGAEINTKLMNSVVIGYGGAGGTGKPAESQQLKINVESDGHGIVAIGSVRVQSNPHEIGRTGNGGQAVAIGNDITSTSQAVAIGNNTYALGNASIAIGSDDISAYEDHLTDYDYRNYFYKLYNKITEKNNPKYGYNRAANANDFASVGNEENLKYSPNMANGKGAISIGSRSVAYNDGTTALGTLAFALGKGSTALGTQSRAEGEGAIAIGNKTRNFANQALAIGNDSQILNIGGTAVGLRAGAAGEGSIAIGTDVFANTAMNNTSSTQNMTQIHDTLKNRNMGVDQTTLDTLESELIKQDSVSAERREYHGIGNIIKNYGATYETNGEVKTQGAKNAIVIGTKSAAVGSNSMALGRGAFAMANNAFGIGSYSYADKDNALAIGTSARALAVGSIVMGAGSVATNISKNATVIGTESRVIGENASVVGSNSEAFSKNTLIYGNQTKVGELDSTNNTDNNIAIGNNISIGSGVTNSMAYGPNSRIGNTDRAVNNKIDNSTAFGSGAKIERLYGITELTADKMTNAEAKSKADADPKFMYTGNNAMAIGNYSRAVLENSVALGVKSDTDYTYSDLLKPGWTARGSIAVPTSGQTGVISVGSKGQERRIVNVASGFRDTDAVNVIQLRTLEETVTNKVEGIESGMHYLSVNKKGPNAGTEIGSAKVTELIERRKNYDQYLRYKTQQLQLKARQNWQGEKFNEASLEEINNKVAELEADTVISTEAAELKNYNVATNVPDGKTAPEAYKELVNELETINSRLKSDAKYAALADNNNIEALKLETNYSNEGGKGVDSLAVGFRASTHKNATEALSVGYKATANGVESVALGSQSAASGNGAVALGADTVASGSNTIAIGSKGDNFTKASGSSAIAIGNGAQTPSNYSVGLGGNVQIDGDTSVGIGDRAATTGRRAVAIGPAAEARGQKSVALGDGAGTGFLSRIENGNKRYDFGNNSVAIGGAAKAYSSDSVVIGDGAESGKMVNKENNTKAFEDSNKTANSSVVLGKNSKSYADGGTVLGAGSTANLKDSVALGKGVTTTESAGAGYITGQAFNESGKVVSVGQRRINQLADGKNDDDAVTVAQLRNAYIKVKGQNKGTAATNDLNVKTTESINITGGSFNSDSSGPRYVGDNIATFIGKDTTTSEATLTIGIKEVPKFKGLILNNGANNTTKDLNLTVDNSGNLNLATNNTDTKAKITNVANGTGDNDAVNYSQLKGAAPKVEAEVGSKITTNPGATLRVQSGDFDNSNRTVRYLGENLSTHIGGTANAPIVTVGLRKDPKFETLKLNNGANNAQDLTLSADNSGNLSVGSKKITNVADGTANNDAVNYSQLNSVKTTADTAKNTADTAKTTANAANTAVTNLGNKGLTFAANSGNVTKKLGETVGIKGDDSTISTSGENNDITIKVKDGGIGTTQLANNAVTGSKLADGAVGTTQLGDNAVTTAKLNDGAVTENKLDGDLKAKINKANTVASNKIRLAGDPETTGGAATKTGEVSLSKEGGIEFAINGKDEIVTKASGTKVEIGLSETLKTKLAKLDNLDANANDKYATKDELANKASTLNIKSGETTETLNLKDDTLKVTGSGDVTVSLNNKEFTIGLSEEAKKKLDNVSAKSDGKDKKDSSKAENADSSGNKGLTKEDKLNGKDLTDKVNALRNGEAGTVVFTDSEGNRLVKANNGKYYKPEFVSATGDPQSNEGAPAVAVDNPELRVVNTDGTTTNPIKLNNLASALEAVREPNKAVTPEKAQEAVKALLAKTGGLDKAVNLADLQAIAQAGLDFVGNAGTTHRALGTTLKIVGKEVENFDATKFNTDYSTENVATNVKEDGTVEIGFKKSPTFTKVTADEVEADKVKVKKELVFDKGDGKPTTIVAGDGNGSLLVNGKKVATSDSAPVLYTNENGAVVEKGLDDKIHLVSELKGKRFDKASKKYYAEDQYDTAGTLKADAQPATFTEVDPTKVKHALASIADGSVTSAKVLTNVGAGKIAADSTDAINGSQIKSVLDKLGVETDAQTGEIKQPTITAIKGANGTDGAAPTTLKDGLNNVISKVNEGIQYKGDLGEKGTQQLGTVFNVNAAGSKLTKTIEATAPDTEATTINYVGDNLITKYTKDTTTGSGKLEIGFKESPTFKDVTATDKITTPEVVLKGKDNSADVKITAEGGKAKVDGKEIATKEALDTVVTNTIKLTANGELPEGAAENTPKTKTSTNEVNLNKKGISFGILGADGIETIADGTDVTVKLSKTYKDKLDNLDNNAKDTYAKKDATNITETEATEWRKKLGLANAVSGTGTLQIDAYTNNKEATEATATDKAKGKATVKLDGKENFRLVGTDGITVTGADGDDNKTLTFGLDQATKDAIKNIGKSISDGRDGLDGTNGHNGSHGLTAADGLNGKDLTEKVNALRNGEAGTTVFTDSEGNRLVKANDGKYYKPEFVSPDGTTKPNEKGEPAVAVDNPELRVVNNDGTTTNPISLNNIASALGLDGKKPGVTPEANYDKPITAEDAKKVMETLLGKNTDLNRAVTLRDLQALAQAGLDFNGNEGTAHRALGTTLNVVGQGTPAADFAGASGNIKVVASEDTANKIAKLEIQLAEALKDIKSIQNGDTKVTLDKDNGVVKVDGKDGGKVVVNGTDGKANVAINGGNGTNGASVSVNGTDGKDGVTIKGGYGTNGATITFEKKADGTGTGSITGLKDPELENGKPKDPTAATTVNYVTNQIEGAKTEITKNIKNIVDGGMTYKGNSGEDVKVELNKAVNIKGEGNYDGTGSATGNIAVVGNNTDKTLEIKLNKDLKNIDTISSKDDNTKITLGENGVSVSGKDGASVSVNGKDGKDGVTIKGTDGTNGSSIVVNGKDGKPGVTINGGNGTDGKDGSISFAKDGENGTGSITGLKDPEFNKDGTPKDKTAAATVNYVTNEIKNVTNNINNAIATMDKGLNFVGNDNEKVNAKLDGTVSIKGEGTVPTGTNTAANNIKVEKDTTDKSTGLVVKLADKLTGMTGFETKEEEGKKVTINKDGITFNKDDKGNGKGSITGLKDPELNEDGTPKDKTAAATVNYVNTEINKSRTIVYKADNQTKDSVSLDKGMEFKGDSNITTKADKDGVVEFKLSKNLDLSTKVGPNYTLGTIKGIKTDEKDPTSVATVDYVEQKMGDTAKIATKALVGVANAVAMANLPQVNNVGNNRHVVSAAYGHYEGQNALALGISGINKERTVVYKGSAALNTNGKIALGVGVGYQFGTDKHDEIQNDASVKALKEEVAVLKNKDAKNTNIITELKELMKKKDIENEYKSYRLEEENKEIKSYIDELRKENEKTREELKKLMEAVKEKKSETK